MCMQRKETMHKTERVKNFIENDEGTCSDNPESHCACVPVAEQEAHHAKWARNFFEQHADKPEAPRSGGVAQLAKHVKNIEADVQRRTAEDVERFRAGRIGILNGSSGLIWV